MLHLENCDCMDLMSRFPDKYFDLAIVDPPYGTVSGRFDKYFSHKCKNGVLARKERIQHRRTDNTKAYTWSTKYALNKITKWDIAPPPEYFTELFRVSENQIIWGGNYFVLPVSNNFIVWEKATISETFTMAICEYAWTNIRGNAKLFKYPPQDKNRFHPTQKPVALYKWLLKNYSKRGYKILDTHLGSGSIAIACLDMGSDLWGSELDADYFEAMSGRIKEYKAQGNLIVPKEIAEAHLF